ncbi:hypothetical protein LUZ63_012240 [Rhynchospora breviuscula]|uniref:Protein kinase domain-containing protein n=1 Tax=Rhynchospora breviuscula TaxID=2022672 RepID=A0A9Q0CKV8_9POAL|nr:hypothetical protein LUZ63_012240 [Rhynchospora breviuscula]
MMKCFPCFSAKERKRAMRREVLPLAFSKLQYRCLTQDEAHDLGRLSKAERALLAENREQNIFSFKFRDLATATDNFSPENLLGQGGFGRVFKGILDTGQIVAVKQLDRDGSQGNKEFMVELLTLSILRHPNLVQLVGYCVHGNQRLLVYEYMPLGSLNTHLFGIPPEQAPLSWYLRMKIAFGSALGLECLHDDKGARPFIYRDLKCTNILLDENYNPKLSDFGLAKLAPRDGGVAAMTKVEGTFGYFAPEYASNRELSVKSDVYSFGVVMLELITGRPVVDNTRPSEEQNLVAWARPMFTDQKRIEYLVDPLLKGYYPQQGLKHAVAVAMMCLQVAPTSRPMISDVVVALMELAIPPEEESSTSSHLKESSQQEKALIRGKNKILEEEPSFSSNLAESSQQEKLLMRGKYKALKGETSTSSNLAKSSQQEKPPMPQRYRTLAEALQWTLETVEEGAEEDETQQWPEFWRR